jgi:hypothetical protein
MSKQEVDTKRMRQKGYTVCSEAKKLFQETGDRKEERNRKKG